MQGSLTQFIIPLNDFWQEHWPTEKQRGKQKYLDSHVLDRTKNEVHLSGKSSKKRQTAAVTGVITYCIIRCPVLGFITGEISLSLPGSAWLSHW